ncbi:molybdopterin-guanine dinucleotide biosynthesis protein MobB [Aminithiophilus ramosus]|uniref:Molybdopterin-guanine dinucleotide biosynthesis protein MobB n=1 Tax=Aminithiophilus ramosus TaxID=3029084 RepID=A0A9Q7ALC0_9BACT|nr:molybdopterin-guanine dinucleotide biosynthesis protein MobB [Aminithiophilus ramosus]
MPFVVAVSGFKDSGKTTLCVELVERLKERGVDVAFIKHSCESPLSGASTDSGRILMRGVPALLWSDEGVRLERAGDLSLEEIVYRFFPAVDIVLVEGAKSLPLPRIWVAPGGRCPRRSPASSPATTGLGAKADRRSGFSDRRGWRLWLPFFSTGGAGRSRRASPFTGERGGFPPRPSSPIFSPAESRAWSGPSREERTSLRG